MSEAIASEVHGVWERRRNSSPKWFVLSAGAILVITGIAKVWSALGNSKFLAVADPIIGITFGQLMLAVGLAEIAIALVCFFSKRQTLALALVAWMSTNFLVYRLGLWWMDWHRPCSCLGNLTDALHIPPQVADNIMKVVLAYLLIGSYGALILRAYRKRLNAVTPAIMVAAFLFFASQPCSAVEYEAHGQLTAEQHLVDGKTVVEAVVVFSVFVHECNWLIRIRSSKPEENYRSWEMSFDGTNQYILGVTEKPGYKKWGGNIGPERVPYFGPTPTIPVIWLALVPRCRIGTAGKMEPPYSTDLIRAELVVHERKHPDAAKLPAEIVFMDDGYSRRDGKPVKRLPPYDTGFTNAILSTGDSRKFDGIVIPTVFELRVYRPRGTRSADKKLEVEFTYSGTVTNIYSVCTNAVFVSKIPDDVQGLISDIRFCPADSVFAIPFLYRSSRWLALSEVREKPEFSNYFSSLPSLKTFVPAQVTSTKPDASSLHLLHSNTRARRVVVALLGVTTVSVGILIWAIARRKSPEDNHTDE